MKVLIHGLGKKSKKRIKEEITTLAAAGVAAGVLLLGGLLGWFLRSLFGTSSKETETKLNKADGSVVGACGEKAGAKPADTSSKPADGTPGPSAPKATASTDDTTSDTTGDTDADTTGGTPAASDDTMAKPASAAPVARVGGEKPVALAEYAPKDSLSEEAKAAFIEYQKQRKLFEESLKEVQAKAKSTEKSAEESKAPSEYIKPSLQALIKACSTLAGADGFTPEEKKGLEEALKTFKEVEASLPALDSEILLSSMSAPKSLYKDLESKNILPDQLKDKATWVSFVELLKTKRG